MIIDITAPKGRGLSESGLIRKAVMSAENEREYQILAKVVIYANALLCPESQIATVSLPDVEIVSAKAHEAWMNAKLKSGFTTRKSESGEELMVPYSELTEAAKDLDRQVVLTIYAAIKAASNSPGLDGKQEAVDRAHNDAIEEAADFVSGMQHVKGTPNALRKLKRVAPTPSRDVTGKESKV